MPSNPLSEVSQIQTFLKKEEALLKKILQLMEQDSMRLQIEELTLKAAIRQEQMRLDAEQLKEDVPNSISPDVVEKEKSNNIPVSEVNDQNFTKGVYHTDQSYKFCDPQSASNTQNSQAETVQSNITDDRYLEPLILNPYGDDEFMEFDD